MMEAKQQHPGDELEIVIRPMAPTDEAFVYQTWLMSMKRSSYECRRIRDAVFYREHHRLIEGILGRGASVVVAHPPGDPDTILGYAVAEPGSPRPVLHWAFVKLAWRRLGIASRLIESVVEDPNRAVFTHWTVWSLSVPAPKGVNRTDRTAIREARSKAVRDAEREGQAGGDTESLLRKWPGLEFNPYLR